jgi:hypothetical protein
MSTKGSSASPAKPTGACSAPLRMPLPVPLVGHEHGLKSKPPARWSMTMRMPPSATPAPWLQRVDVSTYSGNALHRGRKQARRVLHGCAPETLRASSRGQRQAGTPFASRQYLYRFEWIRGCPRYSGVAGHWSNRHDGESPLNRS